MALKELMGWNPTARRWFKKYAGKMFAVSPRQLGTEATKEASRAAANRWWEAKLAELNPTADAPAPSHWATERTKMASYLRSIGEHDRALQTEKMSDQDSRNAFIESLTETIVAHRLGINVEAIEDRAILKDRIAEPTDETPAERTIKHQVQLFLDHKKRGISIGHWDNMRRELVKFINFVGEDQSIDAINSLLIQSYYDSLDPSQRSSQAAFATAKQFIENLTELDLIPVPSKLRSRSLPFTVVRAEIKKYEIAELKNLFDHANERMKLFLCWPSTVALRKSISPNCPTSRQTAPLAISSSKLI